MEIVSILLFCAALVVCVVLNIGIIIPLVFGLFVFTAYARLKRYTWKSIGKMIYKGVCGARNILIVFLMIGVLTALWRDCGTIPAIIDLAKDFIRADTVILMTFLLCCLLSLLTGTSFGTAATMGVICMTVANAMGISPAFAGGAVLAGSFFGDRCSPVSTSALLVADLTGTSIFDNIKGMLKSAIVPFLLSVGGYLVLGIISGTDSALSVTTLPFDSEFSLHPSVFIPAAVIIIMSLFRVNVKLTMLASILAAFIISLTVQKTDAAALLRVAAFGYASDNPEISAMLDGGGVLSMLRSAAIVCISSAYAGIFSETGMLSALKNKILLLADSTTDCLAAAVTSVFTGAVSCNQTLAIMLTYQLCEGKNDKHTMAMNLEDTAVVIAPLIPWSIACAVPLTSVNAPFSAVFFAFFLYLLPVYRIITSFLHKATERRRNYENARHNQEKA